MQLIEDLPIRWQHFCGLTTLHGRLILPRPENAAVAQW